MSGLWIVTEPEAPAAEVGDLAVLADQVHLVP